MMKELIHDGKLERAAAAEALREFLQAMVRASGLERKVSVRAAEGAEGTGDGEAEE